MVRAHAWYTVIRSQSVKLRISKDCARFVIGIFAGELQWQVVLCCCADVLCCWAIALLVVLFMCCCVSYLRGVVCVICAVLKGGPWLWFLWDRVQYLRTQVQRVSCEATCGRSLRIFKKSQYEKLRISKDCVRFVIGIFAGELQWQVVLCCCVDGFCLSQ